MTHNPDHPFNPGECPPCKIILDGGRLAAAALMLAEVTTGAVRASALYLAGIARAATEAMIYGVRAGTIKGDALDEAHALSELACHRAQAIEDMVDQALAGTLDGAVYVAATLRDWATKHRLAHTKLVGGEYHGNFIIDGTAGIARKES